MAKKPPTTGKKCGTSAGYYAHGRRGESACPACKSAVAAQRRQERAGVEPAPKRPKRRRPEPQVAAPATPTAPPRGANPFAVQAPPAPPAPPQETYVEPELEPEVEIPAPPDYLKHKGMALWEAVLSQYTLNPAALELLGEACRTADRLERFAAALSSRSMMWFEVADMDQAEENGVPVIVNGMIGEARQLQTSLRQTLNQLGVIGVEAVNTGNNSKSITDQLAERRAARLAAAQEA